MNETWPWLTLALLGAYHGLNPAMGWLFAVALGLQERRRSAVLRALPPIAVGHAAAIALTVTIVVLAQLVVAPQALRYLCASVLIGFGAYRLMKRNAHPRWVGMRVGFRDLTAWSLLMSTAHGAGLMLAPMLLGFQDTAYGLAAVCGFGTPVARAALAGGAAHTPGLSAAPLWLDNGLTAIGIHSLAMFLVMGVVALVIFEKIGLAILRRAWFNLDLIWAVAMIGAGLITLMI